MRSALAGLLALLAVAVVACSTSTAPQPHSACQSGFILSSGECVPASAHDQVGDACTTADGRSGYVVYAGRDLVCQATRRAPTPVLHTPSFDSVGDPCTTSDGRSGYLVNAGRDGALVCSAT